MFAANEKVFLHKYLYACLFEGIFKPIETHVQIMKFTCRLNTADRIFAMRVPGQRVSNVNKHGRYAHVLA